MPAVDREKNKTILNILKQKGVEWNDEYHPVAMKTRAESGAAAFLEIISLSLTGSLLHLPLLKVSFYPLFLWIHPVISIIFLLAIVNILSYM